MGILNRQLWTTDTNEIMTAIRALIDGQFPVTLHRRSGSPLASQLVAMHTHRHTPYLLLARPPALDDAYQIQDVLFKLGGLPILGFSCPVTRSTDSLLATLLPTALFSVDLRHGQRLAAMPGAKATFFVRGRALVNICQMEDISLGGVKLIGLPTHTIGPKDRIGPCTLSLVGGEALVEREVTINAAAVVRVEKQGQQQRLGLKFDLQENEEQQLREQLNFLSQIK